MPTLFRIYKDGQQQVQGWTRTAAITGTNIDTIPDGLKEFKNSKFATSVPSPFARMHLFETAFKFVKKDMQGKTPYHEFVSECLDMFELIFYSGNNPNAIRYKVWNRDRVDKQRNPNSPLILKSANLADALDGFLKDNRFSNLSSIILIYYVENGKEHLVGGTSPLTYFYVSPNWKKKGFHNISTTGQDILFQRGTVKSLAQRNEDFKEYMLRFFKNNGAILKNQMPELYEYLNNAFIGVGFNPLSDKAIKTIHLADENNTVMSCCGISYEAINNEIIKDEIQATSDFVIDTKKKINGFRPLVLAQGQGIGYKYLPTTTWQGNTLVKDVGGIEHYALDKRILPDTTVQYPYLTIGDFLQTELIKITFNIDKDKFVVGKNNTHLDIDFLLPIKPEYFDYFTLKDLDDQLHIEKSSDGSVSVSLKIPVRNGKEIILKQDYKEESNSEKKTIQQEKLNVGIYPFYKVIDQTKENRYAVMTTSEFPDTYSLHFKKVDGDFSATALEYNQMRTVLQGVASTHSYLINGDYFDIIQIEKTQAKNTRGIIIPRFTEVEMNIAAVNLTFAIDFGTTNTYVSYAQGSQNPVPLELTNAGLEAVFLKESTASYSHDNPKKDFTEAKAFDIREFAPSSNSPTSSVNYPIRTATLEFREFLAGNVYKTLGNIAIAYSLEAEEKKVNAPVANYTTNLKWLFESGNKDINAKKAEDKIQAFFEQTLWSIRNKVIVGGGNLNSLKIFWLTPNSMKGNYINLFEGIWQQAFAKVFPSLPFENVMERKNESSAPYLSLLGEGQAQPAFNVINIDIGGGTTDIIFIIPNENKNYITSFRFAGDDIWGETEWGANLKNNGFVNHITDAVSLEFVKTNKSNIHAYYDAISSRSSNDLMNFMFRYKDEFKVHYKIATNPKLKAVLFLHYAAIIYHIVQFLEFKNIDKLKRISLTGKGSEYLSMVGNDEQISKLTQKMIALFSSPRNEEEKEIHHVINADQLQIVRHSDPKAVTANGVIYESTRPNARLNGSLEPDLLLGTTKPVSLQVDANNKYTFEESKQKQKDVFDNVKRFITLLTEDKSVSNESKDLGIDITIFSNIEEFMRIAEEGFENMAAHRGYTANSKQELDETLFFWALKQPIHYYAQK